MVNDITYLLWTLTWHWNIKFHQFPHGLCFIVFRCYFVRVGFAHMLPGYFNSLWDNPEEYGFMDHYVHILLDILEQRWGGGGAQFKHHYGISKNKHSTTKLCTYYMRCVAREDNYGNYLLYLLLIILWMIYYLSFQSLHFPNHIYQLCCVCCIIIEIISRQCPVAGRDLEYYTNMEM